MRYSNGIWGVVAFLGGLAAVTASAQAPRDGAGARFWERAEIRSDLGLTDDQVEQLEAQHYESAKSMTALRSQMRLRELDLERMFSELEPNEGAIRAKATEIGVLRAELYQHRVAHRLALKTILTPEQEQKLKDIRSLARRSRGVRLRNGARPAPPERAKSSGRKLP